MRHRCVCVYVCVSVPPCVCVSIIYAACTCGMRSRGPRRTLMFPLSLSPLFLERSPTKLEAPHFGSAAWPVRSPDLPLSVAPSPIRLGLQKAPYIQGQLFKWVRSWGFRPDLLTYERALCTCIAFSPAQQVLCFYCFFSDCL